AGSRLRLPGAAGAITPRVPCSLRLSAARPWPCPRHREAAFDRDALAESRAVTLALAVLFAAAGIWLIVRRTVVNDEGLVTEVFARWTALAPLPMLFFQKARPITSLLYAIPSVAGPDVMLYAHVLVAALAGPMIAATARGL